MERHTVSSVIPAKKGIEKSKDGTEDYWTDSEHSGIPTPVLFESPKFGNKKRGSRTGVKTDSGKRIRLLDDVTEDWSEGKPVTDSTYNTRPSGFPDSSNRTRPSGVSHKIFTYEEPSDSDQPEKRVQDKSFNTSKTIEDNLVSRRQSINSTYESRLSKRSLPRKISQKKNITVGLASIRPRSTNKSYRTSKKLGTSLSRNSITNLVDYFSNEEDLNIIAEQKLVPVSTRRQSIADNYRHISKKLSQEITKSTNLKRFPRTIKFAEDLERNTNNKFDDNHSDKISLIIEGTSAAESVLQHLSSKKYSKNNKLNTCRFSTIKRKINVVGNTENNPEYLEQEFEEHNLDSEMNIPKSKKSICRSNNSHNFSKMKANSQQISLKRKGNLIKSNADNEYHSNAAPEVFLANESYDDSAAVKTHQYFPSEKPSKYKKSYSSNSLKTKRKIHVAENTERRPENLPKISKECDLEPELYASRGKRSRKKRSNVVLEDPSGQLRQSKRDGIAVVEVPSGQLRRTKRDGIAVVEALSGQLRRSKRDRIAPLKYWANERRLFRHDNKTGKINCLGIDKGTGEDDECQRYLKRMQEKRQQAKMKKKKTRELPLNSKTAVYNKHTSKNEHVVLHMPFDNISWNSPFGIADNNNNANPGYYISKPLNSSESMFGFLKIRPNEMKPSQISPVSNIYFLVVKGQVKVTINNTVYEFKRMDSFIVPKHQTYSIENLLNSYALLSFSAFKAPFFEYEFK